MAQQNLLEKLRSESPTPTRPRKDVCPTFSDDQAWHPKPVQLPWWQQELKDLEETETESPETKALMTQTETPEITAHEAAQGAETQQSVTLQQVNTQEHTTTEVVKVSTTDVNVAAAGVMLLVIGVAVGRLLV